MPAAGKLHIANRGLWIGRLLPLLGIVLAVVGYFGPWVPHQTAALTVTGSELAWFAKFFPQVREGTVAVRRELFCAPPIIAAVLLGLWARQLDLRPLVRWGAVALAVLIALAALPIYDSPFSAEYRPTLLLTIAGVVMVFLSPLAHRLDRRVYGALFALLAVGGIVPALWQFVRLRPLVVALYGSAIGLGWGLVACALGFVLLLVGGILIAAAK